MQAQELNTLQQNLILGALGVTTIVSLQYLLTGMTSKQLGIGATTVTVTVWEIKVVFVPCLHNLSLSAS